MKASITKTQINTADRTVDLTVSFKTDQNELVSTRTLSVSADVYAKSTIIDRLLDMLEQERMSRRPFPISQTQADTEALGITIRVPD